MIQSNNNFNDVNTFYENFDGQLGSRENIIRFLTENKINYGYTASLISIMNGSAKALLVIRPLSGSKKEILSNNCKITSVPYFEHPVVNNNFDLRNFFPAGVEVISIV
ncbi:MAG: hypothetical protein ACW964_15755 [Candidatus Hodarchaeales archaeon]|jgi:hypothetical protein